MELNDLKIFIELYQNRSISRTAEKLSYTQSNISTRLIKLEQEFNTQLFVRTKSGLELTKDTERFYIHTKKILTSMQNLYQEFSLPSQEITVGSTQLLSRIFFPSLYLQNNMFTLHTANTKKLCRNFSNHMFDLIITHTRLESSPNVICFEKTEDLSWASSIKFTKPVNEGINIVINRDKHCPLRNLSIEATHSLCSGYRLVEVDTLDLMLSLLHTSNCIALLPKKLIDSDIGFISCNFLSPRTLDVFLYCYSNFDKEILNNYFIDYFSFHKSI